MIFVPWTKGNEKMFYITAYGKIERPICLMDKWKRLMVSYITKKDVATFFQISIFSFSFIPNLYPQI